MKRSVNIVYSKFNGESCFTVDEWTYDQMYKDQLLYDDMGEGLKHFRRHEAAKLSNNADLYEVDKFDLLESLVPKETAEIKGFRMKIIYEPINKSEIKQIQTEEAIEFEC